MTTQNEYLFRGSYQGGDPLLFKKEALLRPHPEDPASVLAQFDSVTEDYTHGWHVFKWSEFDDVFLVESLF